MAVDEEQGLPQATDAAATRASTSSSANKTTPPVNKQGRWKQHFTSDVDPVWADLLLILCFFISGVVDSVAFDVWNCFASMQTGNTIFLGLGVSNQPAGGAPYSWVKSLIAILSFIIGAFFFGTYHRLLGPLRRWVLISSFVIQALLISVAAALATSGVVNNRVFVDKVRLPGNRESWTILIEPVNFRDLAPLAMLGFQGAGQIVASRVLKYNELPTVVVTSLFTDLMSDAKLLSAGLTENAKRNRRLAAAVLLFIGAMSGGYLVKSWVTLAGALWIAAFLKGVIAVSWVFWKGAEKAV